MEKVFFVENKDKILEDETLKRKGFEFESADTLGKDKKGYYFVIKADEGFFEECEVLKDAEEIEGEEKEEILQKFSELEGDVMSGMGNIF